MGDASKPILAIRSATIISASKRAVRTSSSVRSSCLACIRPSSISSIWVRRSPSAHESPLEFNGTFDGGVPFEYRLESVTGSISGGISTLMGQGVLTVGGNSFTSGEPLVFAGPGDLSVENLLTFTLTDEFAHLPEPLGPEETWFLQGGATLDFCSSQNRVASSCCSPFC